jgi:hypothetical protein
MSSPDKTAIVLRVDFNHEKRGVEISYVHSPDRHQGAAISTSVSGTEIPVNSAVKNLTFLMVRKSNTVECFDRTGQQLFQLLGRFNLAEFFPNADKAPITDITLGVKIDKEHFKDGDSHDKYAVTSLSVDKL